MCKRRLDILLVEKGMFDSREKARRSIMAGVIKVNGVVEDKPGLKVGDGVEIEVKEAINPFVSRGGVKLQKAIDEFNIDLEGKNCLDVGASTGGFTDCMLKCGALSVYAVDVGYGQLAWKLRNDPRVILMERTNIRYVSKAQIKQPVSFASIDVSFISLKKVLPVVKGLLEEDSEMVCLIKPQFEAGREKVGKKGVVRDINIHMEVVNEIVNFSIESGLYIKNLSYSPVKGPEGNIEYLVYLSKRESIINNPGILVEKVVKASHNVL